MPITQQQFDVNNLYANREDETEDKFVFHTEVIFKKEQLFTVTLNDLESRNKIIQNAFHNQSTNTKWS